MKHLAIALALICWMIITLIGCIFVLGLALVVSFDDRPTTWLTMGKELTQSLTK